MRFGHTPGGYPRKFYDKDDAGDKAPAAAPADEKPAEQSPAEAAADHPMDKGDEKPAPVPAVAVEKKDEGLSTWAIISIGFVVFVCVGVIVYVWKLAKGVKFNKSTGQWERDNANPAA